MIGSKLGPYEITAKLGEGGMGVVWRARDTKLDREVAIKVLPPAFTTDADRLARFEREAKLLAQLNHPGIAHVYGLEAVGGSHALVMELVDGPTLAERLAAGPIPTDEALPLARRIAEALEAAHEKGIVHRDLKPQNIKLAADGEVKVLDFGLAKAMDPVGSSAPTTDDAARSPTLMNSPTLTAAGTQLGVILGTAAYMAPEQARGGAVDKRADIWAFGVVLHEMLTGRRLFAADTVPDTLARVLARDLDLGVLPPTVPPAIRRLLRRCLERNPKNRLRDIGDARLVLDEPATLDAPAGTADAGVVLDLEQRLGGARRRVRGLLALAAILAIVAAALAMRSYRAPAIEPEGEIRFQITPPSELSPTRRGSAFELSPGGRFLVMTNANGIWVRSLDAVSSHQIAQVEGPTYPFLSPDEAWIGFFAENQLKKVPRDGGPVQKICDAPEGRGGSWSPDGAIVFSQDQGVHGLFRVSAQGGTPEPLTQPAAGAPLQYHRYPQFFPDGRTFLYQVLSSVPEVAGIYVGTLDGAPPVRVLEGGDQARFARAVASASDAPGYLLYRRAYVLMAQPFDVSKRKVTGEAVPVADGVGVAMNTGSGAFSLSSSGILAFSNSGDEIAELVWLDRSGKRLGAENQDIRSLQGVGLAPGARRVAYGSGNPADIWVQNLPAGEPSRFRFGPAPGWAYPIWTRDGAEIYYVTWDLSGLPRYEIRRRRVDRSREEELVMEASAAIYAWDLSPDGRALLYGDNVYRTFLLPLDGERKPQPFLPSAGAQVYLQYSPDGKWVAYSSDVQGQFEVFVTTVPPSSALWQISTGGGSMPRWRRDNGRELYYRASDGRLMAVELGAGPGAEAIEGRSAPRQLFVGIPYSGNTPIFTYAPADDGQRFLVAAVRESEQPPITMVLNWQQSLPSIREARQ
ncbi:MAG: protein kinase [Thermoanaerobaculia bacterium]